MLKCIPRSKQIGDDSKHREVDSRCTSTSQKHPSSKPLNSQIKEMSLKATGSSKESPSSSSCSVFDSTARILSKDGGIASRLALESSSERFRWSSWRTASFNSVIANSRSFRRNTGAGTPVEVSASFRRPDPVVYVEESEPKEWDVQVEPGVLITLVSIPPRGGGNDLKRIRFSQDMFNKWQAQRWWAENYERVMELFNVKRCSHHVIPLPTTPKSEEVSKLGSVVDDGAAPVTPPLNRERQPPVNLFHETGSSSDSLDHPHHHPDSTPSLSTTISCVKTEKSSITSTTSSSREVDHSEEVSVDNEWVEEDEPGVFVTIRSLHNGRRELLRVRFSREQFGERRAREWWEENRRRIHRQYL